MIVFELEIISPDTIVSFITKTIDIFAIVIILASFIQSILPLISIVIKSFLPLLTKKIKPKSIEKVNLNVSSQYKISNFIKGMLLALEMETGNAILKMGVFTFYATSDISIQSHEDNIYNFIFFIALFSTRIAINQTIRKYRLPKNVR
ncbi:MAG TPA: hypothetical protein VJU13_10840 [Candidatus Nitrosocosmicus sp.]|nr:hypothetical protein [Candidatus Nitrosocosmicus sp.]